MFSCLRLPGRELLLLTFVLVWSCATNRIDYWKSPELDRAPIPTREELVVILPAHADVKGDSEAVARLAEAAFLSQLEHATVAVGGHDLSADLAAAELHAPADHLGQAFVHAAFVENSEIVAPEHADALAMLTPINRIIDARYAGQPVRWLAVLRIEELPSPRDMQVRLDVAAALWDLKRNALSAVVRFERYAEEGKLGATVRLAATDAASRLTLDTSTPVEEPTEVGF